MVRLTKDAVAMGLIEIRLASDFSSSDCNYFLFSYKQNAVAPLICFHHLWVIRLSNVAAFRHLSKCEICIKYVCIYSHSMNSWKQSLRHSSSYTLPFVVIARLKSQLSTPLSVSVQSRRREAFCICINFLSAKFQIGHECNFKFPCTSMYLYLLRLCGY